MSGNRDESIKKEEEQQDNRQVREKQQEISFTTRSQSYCVCFVSI
jgi:hypothetical protein